MRFLDEEITSRSQWIQRTDTIVNCCLTLELLGFILASGTGYLLLCVAAGKMWKFHPFSRGEP